MTPRRIARPLVLAALVAASLAGGRAAADEDPAGAAPAPIRIAVIDLKHAFDRYERTRVLEAKINAERDRLAAELNAIRAELRKVEDRLKDERLDRAKRADLATARESMSRHLAEAKQRLETEIKGRWSEYNLQIYRAIRAEVGALAREKGFHVVLPKPPEDVTSLDDPAVHGVLFVEGLPDITGEVISRLNARYKESLGEPK